MFLNGKAAFITINLFFTTRGYLAICHKRRNKQWWQTQRRATRVSQCTGEPVSRYFICDNWFMALPVRGVRFLRSRKAAPDCRASIRLSITPVSSPSAREQNHTGNGQYTLTSSLDAERRGGENKTETTTSHQMQASVPKDVNQRERSHVADSSCNSCCSGRECRRCTDDLSDLRRSSGAASRSAILQFLFIVRQRESCHSRLVLFSALIARKERKTQRETTDTGGGAAGWKHPLMLIDRYFFPSSLSLCG